MQSILRLRVLVSALLLLALGAMAAPVRGDEVPAVDEARDYARAELRRRASESVNPARKEAGSLDERKATVEAQRAAYEKLAPDVLQEADRLLGVGGENGLIQQGAILYRWILGAAGESESSPLIRFYDPSGKEPETDYAEDVPEHVLLDWSIQVHRRPDQTVDVAGVDELRVASREKAGLALTEPTELYLWICAPWVAAREKQVESRELTYKGDRPAKGLVNEKTVRRKEARAQNLRRQVETYEALRKRTLQALDRLVRDEERLLEEAGRLGFEMEEARGAARSPGEDGEGAKDEGAEPKDAEEEPEPKNDDGAPADREPRNLDELQLREIVGEQKLRLLYIAVRRAGLRLELYDTAIEQARTEALAAEESHEAYEGQLNLTRREQQMVQLALAERKLSRRYDDAQAKAQEEGRADRKLWAVYERALESLLDVNAETREAVQLRRRLESRTRDPAAVDLANQLPATVVCEVPESPQDAGGSKEAVESKAAHDGGDARESGGQAGSDARATDADDLEEPDRLRAFRDVGPAAMTENYVGAATAMLEDPDWDAALTREHYDAVHARIEALEGALEDVQGAAAIQRRFDEARTQAEEALGRVEADAAGSRDRSWWLSWVGHDRDRILGRHIDALRETLRGIREEVTSVRTNLDVLQDYRARLSNLGERSFLIRVDHSLDGDRLSAAYDDLSDTVGSASRWVTFRGEGHAGSFLSRHWLMLLAGLGVLVVSVFLVKFGRRGLDRVARQLASRVPALRHEVVTVRAEDAQARSRKARDEAAVKAAEEAVLEAVSKEQASQAQKTGEGGYGNGGSA